MTATLVLKTSALGQHPASNTLIDAILPLLPHVKTIDLHHNPPPYWDSGLLNTPQAQSYVQDLMASDRLIIAAPMYNFGLPAVLKSWMDWVAVSGTTFKYTPNGPEGLLKDKKAIIVSTRGGTYAQSPQMDHQKLHLKTFLEFLGIKVHVAEAEGLHITDSKITLERAREQLERLIQTTQK